MDFNVGDEVYYIMDHADELPCIMKGVVNYQRLKSRVSSYVLSSGSLVQGQCAFIGQCEIPLFRKRRKAIIRLVKAFAYRSKKKP